jgi:ergothioneine biosynthesis protein EgtB
VTQIAIQPSAVDRRAFIERFLATRRRSARLFDLLEAEAYYSRPIQLRHPIVFYEGHLAAFNVNTLLRKGLGRTGVDDGLDVLFARGIDPDSTAAAEARTIASWPERARVGEYVEAADRAVLEALTGADLERGTRSGWRWTDLAQTMLEHELMHQETLLYIWHRLPHEQKRRPANAGPVPGGVPPPRETIRVPEGRATLGADASTGAFGWDNEFPAHVVDVPAFEIDRFNVTNADFLEFVEAGGYRQRELWTPDAWEWLTAEAREHPLFWERRTDSEHRWEWRGLFEPVPLPLAWPVYVSQAEASAFARWRHGRLPTEAEFHRAAYGTPVGVEREFPWGDDAPGPAHGNFDFVHWDPVPVGSYPAGRSAWGVDDLIGNGWEWTSSIFGGFAGFRPMPWYPEYSADFFDGEHYVMKGGSPATARELVRRSFRNWFRPQYPYVYATFRCVQV